MKIGLLGALFLLFTGLKLSGIITWSWWWVTAPLWGIPALLLGTALAGFVGAILLAIGISIIDKKEK
jgi:hypothetical protein